MNKNLQFKISNLQYWSSLDHDDYVLEKLSKMQARRMTHFAKVTVDLALRISETSDIDYVIFSSRHGEVTLAYDLIQSIITGNIPSPTKFSQSTHNAIGGLFSIQSKCIAPMTAVSAGRDSFIMGLLNCGNYLALNPKAKVLYLFGDARLPEAYKNTDGEISNEALSIAMILERGSELEVSQHSEPENNVTANQAYQFLKYYNEKVPRFELQSQDFTLSMTR